LHAGLGEGLLKLVQLALKLMLRLLMCFPCQMTLLLLMLKEW